MRSKVVRTLALALVFNGMGFALAQQSSWPRQPGSPPRQSKAPPEKSKLEAMVAAALKNNPDILVAAAKLAEADAELNRTRLQVTQKIVALHHAILSQKATVDYTQKKYDRFRELLANKAIDAKLVDEMFAQLTAVKAKLAELEAQLPAVLGKRAEADAEQLRTLQAHLVLLNELPHLQVNLQGLTSVPAKADGPMAERIRKALQTSIKVDYKDMPFRDVLKDLEKKAPGLSFRDFVRGREQSVTLHFEEAFPVSVILQALADDHAMRFLVRDYGIRVMPMDHMPPPDALTVEQFLRQKPAEPGRTEKRDEQSPNAHMMWSPPDNVEGTIKQINSVGWVGIAFNSVDGLLSGHALYVYRPSDGESKPKYLGTIRIVNVRRKKDTFGEYSDAQPVGHFTETPKVGDKVTSRKPSK
jgi:hypothetical protein